MSEEQQATGIVTVNDDPEAGPLDGAQASVFVVRTRFSKDENAKTRFRQRKVQGKIHASYSLGVVTLAIPGERLSLTVRLDEMMQVMFASAGANKKMAESKAVETEEKKEEEVKSDD